MNQDLLDEVHLFMKTVILLSPIQTFFDAENKQITTSITKYTVPTFVDFGCVTGYYLKLQLCAENHYTSNGVGGFIKPLLVHYLTIVSNQELEIVYSLH